MSQAYAYLVGAIGLGAIFALLCVLRSDLRRVMAYSGLLYLSYGFLMFLVIKILSSDPAKTITPGYWAPPSLFGINSKTGGYGIEDALFSFFAGAIAAGLFELIFALKVSKRTSKTLRKGHALLMAIVAGALFIYFVPVNAIYFFIFLQIFGAAVIVWMRRDLFWHAIVGGTLFAVLYAMLFAIFNSLFPHFIGSYYHLEKTSHLLILGIPLEEYLYALSLGMMWAPIYEYEFRLKDVKARLRPRRA
jgi:hypothetical protein